MVAKKKPRVINMPTLSHLNYYQQKKKIKELASEVKIYNMYDKLENVPPLEDIQKNNKETVKNILTTIKDKHTVRELCRHWNTTSYTLYKKIYPKYGIKTKATGRAASKKDKEIIKQIQPSKEVGKRKEKHPLNGWQIELGGVYTGEVISERILSLDALVSNDKEYKIVLKLEEI